MKLEIWKDIVWYEWLYQISNLWNVKSFKWDKNKNMKLIINKYWYVFVKLSNINYKAFKIHRLVAQAFIPNLENKPQVNHKDWNKQNNCVENLEWCSQSENNLHKYRILKTKPTYWNKWNILWKNPISKKVNQYDLDWNFIKTWDCIKEASLITNIASQSISQVCMNKRNRAGKFIWKYI